MKKYSRSKNQGVGAQKNTCQRAHFSITRGIGASVNRLSGVVVQASGIWSRRAFHSFDFLNLVARLQLP